MYVTTEIVEQDAKRLARNDKPIALKDQKTNEVVFGNNARIILLHRFSRGATCLNDSDAYFLLQIRASVHMSTRMCEYARYRSKFSVKLCNNAPITRVAQRVRWRHTNCYYLGRRHLTRLMGTFAMKDILRQLLDAEESGRQAARAKETEASEILRVGRDQADAIAEEARERASRDIAALEQRVQNEIAERQAEIARDADLQIDQLKRTAQKRRAAAVDGAVVSLLGE